MIGLIAIDLVVELTVPLLILALVNFLMLRYWFDINASFWRVLGWLSIGYLVGYGLPYLILLMTGGLAFSFEVVFDFGVDLVTVVLAEVSLVIFTIAAKKRLKN